MRSLWAGLFVLLLIASNAGAQATGNVQLLGFSGYYRSDCWTPILVHLDSTISTPAEYQIQVSQQDLDQDTVIFTRTVTLGPAGPAGHGDYWVYFLPQPTNGGLRGPNNAASLGDVLKVHLFDKKGKTHIAALPVSREAAGAVQDVDQAGSVGATSEVAPKLVLAVVGDTAAAHEDEYAGALGANERVIMVKISPRQLPDHMLGYQGVDAVLWLNGDWGKVHGTAAFTALQQWVKHGGQLAVCQPSDRTQLEPLADADMLPVIAKSGGGATAAWLIRMRQKPDLAHLADIATTGAIGFTEGLRAWESMAKAGRNYEIAYAQPKPDAMVDAWVTWPEEGEKPEEKTPLIARRAYGTGAVTWVAQNLGSPELVACPDPKAPPPLRGSPGKPLYTSGWPRIWDRVFGWRNQARTLSEIKTNYGENSSDWQYNEGISVDLGGGVIKGMEHSSRSSTYIFIAILFFIVYWIIAGPGTYLYLAGKKKKGLSWTIFGAAAVAATLLTVLVVKIVLRGGPVARHVSVVKLVPDAPAADGSPRFAADISSRIGLYIPKDGYQRVALPASGPDRVAAVAPYAIPPKWLKKETDAGFTDTARYVVDTDPVLSGTAPATDFFFRSTLKKVQAQWSGTVAEGIAGQAKLSKADSDLQPITGVLTNKTGRALLNVYFVFSYGWMDANASGGRDEDRVFYVPDWPNNAAIDLAAEYARSAIMPERTPDSRERVRGRLEPNTGKSWTKYFYGDLPRSFSSEQWEDRKKGYPVSFPLMALVDRIGPSRRSTPDSERHNPIRRGFRDMDVSPLVASGRLVVLGHADNAPVPLPLSVNGEDVGGEGITFYEIALPLDREAMRPPPPATKPTSRPATTRAATEPAK
jgi:hypothetical protein